MLGALTIGGWECPGREWWTRELKKANKPPCWLKHTKTAPKTGGFLHCLT